MSKQEESVELKPCPHCGGRAVLERDTYSNDDYVTEYWMEHVCCDVCGCMTLSFATEGEAVEVWNTRAPSQQPDREMLKRFFDLITDKMTDISGSVVFLQDQTKRKWIRDFLKSESRLSDVKEGE